MPQLGLGLGLHKLSNIVSPTVFDPLNVANCVRWFDFSDIATVTKDGTGKISVVQDKSVTNVSAVQPTATLQPIYVIGGFGSKGLNHAVLDGIDDFMDLGIVSSKLPNRTVFAVYSYNALGKTQAILGESNNSGQAQTNGINIDNRFTTVDLCESVFGDGTNYRIVRTTETNAINTPYIISDNYSGGASTVIERNGTGLTEIDAGGTSVSIGGVKYKMSLGRYGQFNGIYADILFAEILIYDRSLTTSEVAYITNGLNNKYGIY